MGTDPSSDVEVFERIIKMWRKLPDPMKPYAPIQIAYKALGSGTPANAAKVGRVVYAYRSYFRWEGDHHGRPIVPNWEAVRRDFPSLLVAAQKKTGVENGPSASNDYDEMCRALEDERRAVRLDTQKNPIRIEDGRRLPELELPSNHVYQFTYWMDRDDVVFPVPDGVPVHLVWPGIQETPGTLLSQEPGEWRLIVTVDHLIPSEVLSRRGVLRPRLEELVIATRRAVENARAARGLQDSLLNKNGIPAAIRDASISSTSLDASQVAAAEHAFRHSLTFLWGPPGTGKTHTLGEVIAHLVRAGVRVLATATANVAVDQICLKARDALIRHGQQDLLDEGRVLRFGHARDLDVLRDRRFFPDKERARELRAQLTDIRAQLRHPEKLTIEARARLNLESKRVSEELRELTKTSLDQARVVFTTVTQTCIDTFDEVAPLFQAVIIDEASMLSIPHLVAVARRAGGQLVVAGDFRQLGPIALAKTEHAERWLHRDVFQLLDIATTTPPRHPALAMLRTQRRMHPDVSRCINKPFYGGLLEDGASSSTTAACQLKPLAGRGALLVEVAPGDDCVVEQTAGGSRCNRGTAARAVRLATWLARQDHSRRVGIIAPYRAQVRLIQSLLKGDDIARNVSDRIHVGTVHTFQGSEREVIVWDLVEMRDSRMGQLYRGDQGNRLANVAITRAQGKLIILGDPKAFTDAPGAETVRQLRSILQGLGPNRISWSDVERQMV